MNLGLLFSLRLLGQPTLTPWGCIFLCFLNKTELLHGAITLVHPRKLHGAITSVHLLLQIFVAMRQNRGNCKLPRQNDGIAVGLRFSRRKLYVSINGKPYNISKENNIISYLVVIQNELPTLAKWTMVRMMRYLLTLSLNIGTTMKCQALSWLHGIHWCANHYLHEAHSLLEKLTVKQTKYRIWLGALMGQHTSTARSFLGKPETANATMQSPRNVPFFNVKSFQF